MQCLHCCCGVRCFPDRWQMVPSPAQPSPAQPSPGAATLLGLTESIDNILIHFGIHSYAIFTQIIFLLIIVDFLFAGFPHGFPESKLNFTSSSGGH